MAVIEETVPGAMVQDYQRDGVVLVKGLFRDWVDVLRAGVEKNMADPSPQLMATLKPGEKGRFFDDYCNWQRIPEFEQAIRGSGVAGVAAALMGVALWFLMRPLDPLFSGTALERGGAILALMAAGLGSFAVMAFVLGVLDKATLGRLMRRQA